MAAVPEHAPAGDPVAIRRAGPDDADALSALGWETFLETFVDKLGCRYPAADLSAFFAAGYAPARIAAELRRPGEAAWIAERAGRAVGYATAGACTLPHPDARPADGELKRLYLRREAQGAGLGDRLLTAALGWLAPDGARPLWIGVWSGNGPAQRFYARHGFAKAGEYLYPVGATRDLEWILRRDGSGAIGAG